MRFFAVALIFFGVTASYAQTPQVPHKMHFADMTLTIRDDARREIQKDVDALTRYPKYFNIKVERARTYFPLIEKIFEEERLPADFKYLVLQESALIADAVSVSNAVGYWQFKDFTAMEMGMRVDNQVDERKNIIAASRGAAKYLKQNNYMFNNWLYALQAYQMGAGGVQRTVGDKHNGDRHMEITTDTYWYVKKFLAHKIAFEDAVKGEAQVKLQVYPVQGKRKVSDLAKELGVEEEVLRENNKWILKDAIPEDRTYALLVPSGKFNPEFTTLFVSSGSNTDQKATARAEETIRKEINGVWAIQARKNENIAALASRAGVGLKSFLKYNDIKSSHTVRPGEFYFISRKKNTSVSLSHTLIAGEDLWIVSQHYGISLKRLKRYNNILSGNEIKQGDVVWLTTNKPIQTESKEVAEVISVQNDKEEYFNWEVKTSIAKSNGAVINKEEQIEVKSEENFRDKEDIVVQRPEVVEKQDALIIDEVNPVVHVVTGGETLYAISKKYNVTVSQLAEWNKLDLTQGIKPGQEIVTQPPRTETVSLPEETQANKTGWVIHEVKPSDTLYSVARQYNVTIKEIMDWNAKSDFSLALGEKLKILAK